MAKCGLCQTSVSKLHKFEYQSKKSWVCTACNSRLGNGHQLGRDKNLNWMTLTLNLARLVGSLVSTKGRQLLLGRNK